MVDNLAASRGRVFTCVESLGATPPPSGQVASITVATGEMMNIDISDYLPLHVEVDGPYVHWWTVASQHVLLRASTGGGPAETLWSTDSGRFIQAMALDECNVYWLAADPSEIYFRAK